MREEYIKTMSGQIVGIIRTASNGDKTAFQYPSMKILGYYRANIDMTTNLYGKALNRGDSTIALVWENSLYNK